MTSTAPDGINPVMINTGYFTFTNFYFWYGFYFRPSPRVEV